MDFITEKSKELQQASTCCEEVKQAVERWLKAVGTEHEEVETKHYFHVLEENIVGIDELIALASSQQGIQYFGAETAANIKKHGEEIKAAGALYCDCPACAAVEAILEKKEEV